MTASTLRTAALSLAAVAVIVSCGARDENEREHLGATVQPAVWGEEALLVADDASELGEAVAIDGNTIAVGTSGGDYTYVHVFDRGSDGWIHSDTLKADPFVDDDAFGTAVALKGNTLVVGAPYDGINPGASGAVYVFTRSLGVWSQPQRLTAPVLLSGDHFGYALALGDDVLAVGAPGDSEAASGAGAVHIFRRAGGVWSSAGKLVADDAKVEDAFGYALSLGDDDVVAVGAPDVHVEGKHVGAVYVYRHDAGSDTWSHAPRLEGKGSDHLGFAVALDGKTLLAGAPGRNNWEVGAVATYTEDAGTWLKGPEIPCPTDEKGTGFGMSLSLRGKRALVGSYAEGDVGAARLFVREGNTWLPLSQPPFGPREPVVDGSFGWAVAYDGTRAVVTHLLDGSAADEGGAAYVWALVGTGCSTGDQCTTGHCVDGKCCDKPCDGKCDRCDLQDKEGLCTPVPAGSQGTPSCPDHLVCGGTSDCPTQCSQHSDCVDTHHCLDGDCKEKKPRSSACEEAAECLSGHCVDGVCCNEACGEPCQACDVAANVGTCVGVEGDPRGARTCPDARCVDGVAHSAATCEGGPACAAPEPLPCKPYVCGDVTCKGSCDSDGDCAKSTVCDVDSRRCLPEHPVCRPPSTLENPDGTETSCAPFRCAGYPGECTPRCSSSGDCVDGFFCASDGRCSARPDGGQVGGCSVTTQGTDDDLGVVMVLFGFALLRLRRRARRVEQARRGGACTAT